MNLFKIFCVILLVSPLFVLSLQLGVCRTLTFDCFASDQVRPTDS